MLCRHIVNISSVCYLSHSEVFAKYKFQSWWSFKFSIFYSLFYDVPKGEFTVKFSLQGMDGYRKFNISVDLYTHHKKISLYKVIVFQVPQTSPLPQCLFSSGLLLNFMALPLQKWDSGGTYTGRQMCTHFCVVSACLTEALAAFVLQYMFKDESSRTLEHSFWSKGQAHLLCLFLNKRVGLSCEPPLCMLASLALHHLSCALGLRDPSSASSHTRAVLFVWLLLLL